MSPQPLPEAWRSEAFAEDLPDSPAPAPVSRRRRSVGVVLLGVVPLMLATAGAALAAWVRF